MRWTIDLNQLRSSGVRGSPPRQSACRYPSHFFNTGERNISFTAVYNLSLRRTVCSFRKLK